MSGGATLTRDPTTLVDNGSLPENPFRTYHRGFDRLPDRRLADVRARYQAWLTRAEAEAGWPPPENARLYCFAVVEEIENEISRRAGGEEGVAA